MKEDLIERLRWLIDLRWLAIIGLVVTIFSVAHIIRIPLQASPLYTIAAILGIYNTTFLFYLNRIKRSAKDDDLARKTNRIANIQISLDLVSLTALIHFSGGIENPFALYFIFHMIIASILLSRKASFLQATFAALLFALIVFLEYLGALPHYPLKGFIPFTLHDKPLYIFGIYFVFTSTIYIAVYMATSISTRLRERERNLKEANLLLEEKDRVKSEYVLRVSHDIKEHLSAIQSCIEPVIGGITGSLNEGQANLLKRADERAERLAGFVRALLEVTRMKLAKGIEAGSCSVKKLIERAVNLVEASAKDAGLAIHCQIDPAIDKIGGTELYIEEAITNLLTNSVKYTPRNGRIDISVKDNGPSILIQIADTGIGIPKDEICAVFDEFYRGRNAKDIDRYGTGLGLSITKQAVEMHNGKIWVDSEEGKGTTFNIVLPKT